MRHHRRLRISSIARSAKHKSQSQSTKNRFIFVNVSTKRIFASLACIIMLSTKLKILRKCNVRTRVVRRIWSQVQSFARLCLWTFRKTTRKFINSSWFQKIPTSRSVQRSNVRVLSERQTKQA